MSYSSRRPSSSLIPEGFGLRLLAMLGALTLVGATIYTLHNQFLASQKAERAAAEREAAEREVAQRGAGNEPAAAERKGPWEETIIPGPSDTDPAEREEMTRFLEEVTDRRAGIDAWDMPAYFRMLKWTLSQPMTELESRSNREVTFGKLIKHPKMYRGDLIQLRMHVRRVLRDSGKEVPENPLGLTELYYIYGGTDDSGSYTYELVVPELPPGIRVGLKSEGEVVFAGYFLKNLGYEASDQKPWMAPVLIGRIRKLGGGGGKQVADARTSGLTAMAIGGAVLVCVMIMLTGLFRMTRRRRSSVSLGGFSPSETANVENWLEQGQFSDLDGPSGARQTISTNGDSHHHNGDSAG
jgi:hypothetical protein